jgi:hypothetical protein
MNTYVKFGKRALKIQNCSAHHVLGLYSEFLLWNIRISKNENIGEGEDAGFSNGVGSL